MSREAVLDWSEIYERLVRRPEQPDPLAWEALERRVRAWTHDDQAAAETCAEVWRTLNLARGGAAFEGFVQGRLVEVNRRASSLPSPGARERGISQVSSTGATTGDARGERLLACLEELRARNPRHSRSLSLLYEDRATVQEAADILEVDTWTVRLLAARARQALAQCLERSARKRGTGAARNGGAAADETPPRSASKPGRAGPGHGGRTAQSASQTRSGQGQRGRGSGRQRKGRPPGGGRPR